MKTRIRLRLTVEYSNNRVRIAELELRLARALRGIYEQGLLTGDSLAEVDAFRLEDVSIEIF